MGALNDPIIWITFTCRECGMEFTEWGDTDDAIEKARADFADHVETSHRGNDE